MTEEIQTPAAPSMERFDYGHLPEVLHVLGRPFYALAHHLKDVLGHGKQLDEALAHLEAARGIAIPVEQIVQTEEKAAEPAPAAEPDK